MISSISYTEEFLAEFKRLSKKYHSLRDDFKKLQISLCKNPNQGSALPLHLRKCQRPSSKTAGYFFKPAGEAVLF